MKAYEFKNYKAFVKARVEAKPNKGRGEFQRIALRIQAHPSYVSQVFRGDKELTPEQAIRLAQYLALDATETEYFLDLVHFARAGDPDLRRYYLERTAALREKAMQPSQSFPKPGMIDEAAKGVFYSNWYYSAVRLYASIKGCDTVDRLADRLRLPASAVSEVVDFLLAQGLLVEVKGRLALGPKQTYLERGSPHIGRHHVNWRLRAIERYPVVPNDELAFTAPFSISVADAEKLRAEMLRLVESLSSTVAATEPERVMCLTMDLFEVK